VQNLPPARLGDCTAGRIADTASFTGRDLTPDDAAGPDPTLRLAVSPSRQRVLLWLVAAVLALPVVVFVSLQRYFVRGLLAGSVKG